MDNNKIKDIVNTVGFIHNEALDYLTQNPKFPNIPEKELFFLISNFVTNKFRDVGLFFKGVDFNSVQLYLKDYLKKPQKYINHLLLNGFLNDYTHEILNLIIEKSNDIENPRYVYAELKGLIAYLTENIKLAEKERNLLIGSANIAIYSNLYWNYQYNNPDSPWKNTKALPEWIKRDIQGFVSGCVSCMAAGPEACIGCGVVMAIISSAVGDK